MAASWDRGSAGFRDDWLPRLAPYHHDLVSETALKPKQSVSASPDVAPFVVRAGGDVGARPPWDAIISTDSIAPGWSDALAPNGKVAVLVWGPDDPDDPIALLERVTVTPPAVGRTLEPSLADRSRLAQRLHENGFVLVRHTVIRHTLYFPRAEELAGSVVRACTWRADFESQNEARRGKALALFYDAVGGPDRPVAWEPAATVVIAGLPGAEIELPHRPSVKIPL